MQISSSAARDVKAYSAIPKEDELLMPCGIGFAPTDVQADTADPQKLTVSLQQTEAMLLEDASDDGASGTGTGNEVTAAAPRADVSSPAHPFLQSPPPYFILYQHTFTLAQDDKT